MNNLENKFSRFHPGLIELLELMLEFNPVFRPSAGDLLKLPIFDEIRVSNLETWIKEKAHLKIETSESMLSFAMDTEACQDD